MLKFILPIVIVGLLLSTVVGFLLYQRQTTPKVKQAVIQKQDTVDQSNPASPITAEASVPPPLELSAEDTVIVSRINDLAKQIAKLTGFDTKVDNLEKQIDDLNSRIAKLEGSTTTYSVAPSATPVAVATTAKVTGPMYLYALGYGGSSPSTDWTEISTMTLAFDPAMYPGYKSLQLEAYMRVRDGNGKAFARLFVSGTAATASEVSTGNYQDEWVSGGTFTWNSKSTFTLQIKSLTGYDAYISNARIKVNF